VPRRTGEGDARKDQHDPDEVLASVQKGLYAKNFGGGQVDITSGKFVFSASEAYLIENGKITRLRRECPNEGCGAGVFMAAMHNRQYCGRCHLTYVFDETK